MPQKKVQIIKQAVFAFGGHRASRNSNKWEIPAAKTRHDVACLEDDGRATVKGEIERSLKFEGWGTEAEVALLDMLAEEDRTFAFTLLRETSITATPAAAPGSAALLMDAGLFELPAEAVKGSVKKFAATCEPTGSDLYFGMTLFTNVNDAPLEDGETLSVGVDFTDSLDEGFELAFSFHVLDFPGFLGTDTEVVIELLADAADDLASPSVVYESDPITEPDGFLVIIDGDTDPFPSEPFFGVRITVSSTATDAEVTVITAAALAPKA